MKTIRNIFSLLILSTLLSVSISSCSKNKPIQEEVIMETVEIKQECPIDENTLMIVANLTIKDEANRTDLLKALHQVVDGTRQEEGNIAYVLHQDINDPMTYIIFEVWKSQEAINFHNETPHFKAFVEAVGDKAILSVNTMKKVY